MPSRPIEYSRTASEITDGDARLERARRECPELDELFSDLDLSDVGERAIEVIAELDSDKPESDAPIVRASARPFKLPTGQTLKTSDPVKELDRNIWFRRDALQTDLINNPDDGDERYLADLWEIDAKNVLNGRDLDQRAAALNLNREGLADFLTIVDALNEHLWCKADDFYRGMVASGMFDRPTKVYGGVAYKGEVRELKAPGVSRATIYRRIQSVSLSELLRPARRKVVTTHIEYEGATFSPRQFAEAFSLPRRHVYAGLERGLSPAEIIAAPKARRGRRAKIQ